MAHNSVNVVGNVRASIIGGLSDSFSLSNRVGIIEEKGERIILNTDKPYILDYLEWSTNHSIDTRIEIWIKNKNHPNGILITRSVDRRGNGFRNNTNAENIINHYSGLWDILDYDENANAYKFRFRLTGVEFPEGLFIKAINDGDEPRNLTIMVYGRELR